MVSVSPHVGVGLYSLPEAARLLRIKPPRLRRWIREYEYVAGDRPRTHHSVVKRRLPGSERTLTFLELMELHFIAMFLSEGVCISTIRCAAEAAVKKFDTDYPFAVKRFDTDGRTIFATLRREAEKEDVALVEDLKHGQQVFDQIMRPFFKKIEYGETHEAMRYWPLEKSGGVVLDPARKFGKPIEADSGIPSRAIYDAVLAESNHDPSLVADWFGIPVSAVLAALRFEQSLAP